MHSTETTQPLRSQLSWDSMCYTPAWMMENKGRREREPACGFVCMSLWHDLPMEASLFSSLQAPAWPRQSLRHNQKCLCTRQRPWPWTARMTHLTAITICFGTNSLPAGSWFSLFAKKLTSQRMPHRIVSLWTSRKQPKPLVSRSQTCSWRMPGRISVLSGAHDDTDGRENLTETSDFSTHAQVGDGEGLRQEKNITMEFSWK